MSLQRDLRPFQILALLGERGLTYAEIDRRYKLPEGVARSAARMAKKKGEEAIADALDRPTHTIWPSRYDRRGRRLRPQPRENYSPVPQFSTVNNRVRDEQRRVAS